MTDKKKKIISIVLISVIVLQMLFIFGNSMKNGESSTEDSDSVIELLRPVFNFFGVTDYKVLNYAVRKAAHLFEFFVLGVVLTTGASFSKKQYRKSLYGIALFLGLCTAVVDEFIQKFTGRTSMVTDVLIDFSGFLLGMAIVLLIIKLTHRQKYSKKCREKSAE